MLLSTNNVGFNPTIFDKSTAKNMNASETVYKNVAIPKVLNKLDLVNVNPTTEMEIFLAKRADGKMAIDHFVKDNEGTMASVQTRFRGPNYAKYGDFTIRYDKPSAAAYTGGSVLCEYHHFNADLMLYGICDEDLQVDPEKVTDLIKWVLVNVVEFRRLCKENKIIQKEGIGFKCKKEGDALVCPVISNAGSKDTRFTSVDVKLANEMFPKLIIAQKNFL